MIESYQDEVKLKKAEIKEQEFATIGTVSGNTATLLFDDAIAVSTKYYKSNKSIVFVSGNRVKISKCSGTYVIEYAI